MSVMGTRVLRKEDPKFLTQGAVYTADLRDPRLDGALHVAYVRSPVAHGVLNSVEVDDARDMPGVVAIYTAGDLEATVLPGMIPMFPESMLNRPILATGKVRFVGEPVAAVVAETPQQAADAAELVYADVEPLEAVVDIEDAATDRVVVHDAVGTNTAVDMVAFGMVTGVTDDSFFDGCDVVVRQRVINNKTAACPLEVRSAACTWENDRLVMWFSNQGPHGTKGALAGLYGLDPGQIHLIVPDVGGGFGAKIAPYPEEVLLPWISKQLGRPIRWFETRTENMLAMGPGRAQVQQIAIGGDRDGTVKAYRIEVIGDVGAYARMGGFLPFFTHSMSSGVYAIPKIETSAKSVITNTTPTEAYRGAGRPEATAGVERAMDMFAAEIGMDPVEVRRKNLISADAMPFTTAVGTEYDSGDYSAALDAALQAAGYDELRADQARRREAGDRLQLGIGVSVYVEVTAGPAPGGHENAKVVITPDGKAKVYSGSLSHGQSHATTFAMLAADQLGMSVNDVEIIQGDTDLVPEGVGTFGSRSLQLGGSAVFQAAGEVVEAARKIAAGLLEANVDDIVLDTDNGTFHVAGTPAVSKSWADLVAAAGDEGLEAATKYDGGATYPFGAHVVVVEVDVETGQVRVDRVITCDDSGIILNPMVMEGQRHGGIAQGVAQALLEEVVYDAEGNPVTANFADYGIISMAELPSYELVPMETPTDRNVLGVKGIGESGAIGATPATQSAVVDAVSHLGIRHIDIPCTPQKVWAAIQSARG
ncbi:MAG: xanthine dehydrogenase family protein molybdopterin-binding subunit [Acidimicrobiales bacterium]|nr:xanthine dehydrogenase family protein molybdopterin-binding subunit [Acidimicrobiales bacterium]